MPGRYIKENSSNVYKTRINKYRLKQCISFKNTNVLFQEANDTLDHQKNQLPNYAGFDRNSAI